MKLDSPRNMRQMAGVRCRQSPLRGFIAGLIAGAIFMGAGYFGKQHGVPWYVWGGCVAVGAVIMALFSLDSLAKCRSTSWLMWLCPDGFWINLRSYQNSHLPDAATILHLRYEEVAQVHRHIETYSTPGRGGHASPHWKLEALELHLKPSDTRQVAEALAEERGIHATIKGTHQAVTVPTPGVIRIGWRGCDNDVMPSLTRVLNELSRHVKLAEPTRTDRGDWRQMSEDELDELVAHLVRSGDSLDAGELLVQSRGCSSTEAHKLVKELASRL